MMNYSEDNLGAMNITCITNYIRFLQTFSLLPSVVKNSILHLFA